MFKFIQRNFGKQTLTPMCAERIPSDTFAQIREMASRLPSWERAYAGNGDRIVEVDVEAGKSTLYGLDKTPNASVCRLVSEPGTIYYWHLHGEDEFIVVISGYMEVQFLEHTAKTLKSGGMCHIPAKETHRAIFHERTEAYVIGIPSIDGFPSGGRFSDEREKYGLG